jgi:hypothetical protein
VRVVRRRAAAVHDGVVHGRVRCAVLRLVVEEPGDVFGRRDLLRELLIVNNDAEWRAAGSSGRVVRRLDELADESHCYPFTFTFP